jgi:4a-hydroxytetrahydrobiopterin dehydratase
MQLVDMKCERPRDGQTPMTPDEAAAMAPQIPEWSVREKTIERHYKFGGFREAITFIDRVADLAEQEDHHPDIHNSYNRVTIELSTHKVGGLSMNDFILAAKIDGIVSELLERKQ